MYSVNKKRKQSSGSAGKDSPGKKTNTEIVREWKEKKRKILKDTQKDREQREGDRKFKKDKMLEED